MCHVRLALLAGLTVLTLCGASFAGTVSLTFENVGPGNQVGGEYTYPYYFSINGSSTLTPLLCDTYSNSITWGESWKANATPLTADQGLWMNEPNALKNYEAAAIIFSWILNGTVPSGQVTPGGVSGNLAVWALFDGGRGNSGWVPADQTLVNQALALTGSQSLAFYAQFTVYTPIPGTQSTGGTAQEFIGCNGGGTCLQAAPMLPEPASFPVLGIGILALAGVLRRCVL